jgi:hypothetical protein
MTPLEVEEAARRTYNAVSDSFWSQDEIMNLIWHAQQEMAIEAEIIERSYTTTTVAGTQEYAFPTNAMFIKRVTYNGQKLTPIDFLDDDELTNYDSDTTDQGNSRFYTQWNEAIQLRPIPSSAVTLKIYSINAPQEVTTTSSLEVPASLHRYLVAYVLKEMVSKDQNAIFHDRYALQWANGMDMARKYKAKRKRADGFAHVKNQEFVAITQLGKV